MNTNRLLLATNLILLFLVFNLMISLNADPAQGAGSGQISACANKSTGALRIASKCAKTENPISWGKQGLTGARGQAGPQGETGPRGQAGPQGETGSRGPAGASTFPNTKDVTIDYLSSFWDCPNRNFFEKFYVFPWSSEQATEANSTLSSAKNWTRIWKCSTTFKVVQ
jgi:hypothetical protein